MLVKREINQGRVGAQVQNGMIADGSGQVIYDSVGETKRSVLGFPRQWSKNDAAGAADREDHRVPANSQKTIAVGTKRAFGLAALAVDSACAAYFRITSIKNGELELLAKGGDVSVPASMFTEVSTINPLRMFEEGETIDKNIPLEITVVNLSDTIRAFDAAFLGDYAQ